MRPNFFIDRCCFKKTTVALVGGGGKTTLMLWLAERCAQRGKNVLVGTTTHIRKPERNVAENLEEANTLWKSGRFAVIGTPASGGKLTSAPLELYAPLAERADLVFLEADGSKCHPCKVPAAHEPVIPQSCDVVLGVMGMTALGKPLEKVCFRFGQEGTWLNAKPKELLDETIAAHILSDARGSRKSVGEREYIAILNQCDNETLIARAQLIQKKLAEKHIPAILTSFYPRSSEETAYGNGEHHV